MKLWVGHDVILMHLVYPEYMCSTEGESDSGSVAIK